LHAAPTLLGKMGYYFVQIPPDVLFASLALIEFAHIVSTVVLQQPEAGCTPSGMAPPRNSAGVL
jgi:hypothetical protein